MNEGRPGGRSALITENRISSERKNKDLEMVDSYFRTFVASNENWIVPVTKDNRRFTVFDVADDNRV